MSNKIKVYIILALFLITGIAIFFIGRSTISNEEAEQVITQTILDTKLNQLEDSLKSKYLQEKADSSEVIQKYHKKISDELKTRVSLESKLAAYKVEIARLDTTNSQTCFDALDEQQRVIFSMGLRAYNDSIQIAECDYQKSVKDSTIQEKERAFKNQLFITNNLQSTLEKLSVEKVYIPHADLSINTLGYIGIGGGVYIRNISIGAKYMFDFNKNKAFEINTSLKF